MSNSNETSPKKESDSNRLKTMEQVKLNPNDWTARKLAASSLYDFKKYSEAAELLWSAPELPYKSQDIAFSVKVIAKDNPKNAMRLVKEVMKRNGKYAEGFLRLAKAFHEEGLPLLASRLYGAALAVTGDNFDIGFEQESLWFDDHGKLVAEWRRQAYEPSPNDPSEMKEFLGKEISFLEYTQKITARVNVSAKVAHLKLSDNPKIIAPTRPVAPMATPVVVPMSASIENPVTLEYAEPPLTDEVRLPALKPVLAFGGITESSSVSDVNDTPELDSPEPTSEKDSIESKPIESDLSESDTSENNEPLSTPKIVATPAFSPREILVTPSPSARTVPLFIPSVKPVDESE